MKYKKENYNLKEKQTIRPTALRQSLCKTKTINRQKEN